MILCDTGSTDRTVAKAKEFAASKGELHKLTVTEFDWSDDFAAARNEADRHATGEWLVWCDLDDTIQGLGELRRMVADASPETAAFFCHYDYARDPDGNTISELWRERVVRNDGTAWQGRLHEHKLFTQGLIVRVDPRTTDWIHQRDHDKDRTGGRNLRILTAWDRDEPQNARILHALGMEHMGAGQHADAAETFQRYLRCPGESADRRAQASRYLASMLLQLGRSGEAKQAALSSLSELWGWADTHLSLAEIAQTEGRPQDGYLHAETALRIGKPDTLLIVNPVQYTVHPRAVMAICCAQLGRFEEAVELAERALEEAPSYQLLTQNLPLWRGALKRERTVLGYLHNAQLLTESGELLKARKLMDCVPWFATDEPRVVEVRTRLERELRDAMTRALPAPSEGAAGFVLDQLGEVAGDAA